MHWRMAAKHFYFLCTVLTVPPAIKAPYRPIHTINDLQVKNSCGVTNKADQGKERLLNMERFGFFHGGEVTVQYAHTT